jgi:hypothetical protein
MLKALVCSGDPDKRDQPQVEGTNHKLSNSRQMKSSECASKGDKMKNRGMSPWTRCISLAFTRVSAGRPSRRSNSQAITAMMSATTQNSRPVSWPWGRRDHFQYGASFSTVSERYGDDGFERHQKHLQAIIEEEKAAPHLNVNRELWTRDLCIVGLILGWGAALSSLATGIYTITSERVTIPPFLVNRVVLVGPTSLTFLKPTSKYISGHRLYPVSEAAMIIIPLLLQIALTLVSACLHNTNLRLFTSSKIRGPNGWPVNIASSIGLIIAYAGTVMATFTVTVVAVMEPNVDPNVDPANYAADPGPDKFAIDFNGWGLLGLGLGLLIQSAICTWCLVYDASAHLVGTWNSNPLATAKACRVLDIFRDLPENPPTAGSNPTLTPLAEPRTRQPSMRALVPRTRAITNGIWAVYAVYAIFSIVVAIVAVKVQHTANLDSVRQDKTNDRSAAVSFADVWKSFGKVSYGYGSFYIKSLRREWAGLLLQCVAVAPSLLGLHLAQLLAELDRDETMWRRAADGRHGTSADSNLLLENFKSWPSCTVLVFKALVPWIFSYAFACNAWVHMALFPLLTVSAAFLAVGIFAEYLLRAQPKGPQPATYGDVRALVALVDDDSWGHERIFWGDKGECTRARGIRVAGTAGKKLDELKMNIAYLGLIH